MAPTIVLNRMPRMLLDNWTTEQIRRKFADVFGHAPEIITFAPGRIEFLGNHTDYNGGPVLGAAINRGVWVAFARRADSRWRMASDYRQGVLHTVDVAAYEFVKQCGEAAWANYPLGVLSVLPAYGYSVPDGFNFLATSNLPVGSGLSSSAAIELASALAFIAVTGRHCPPDILAQIGRSAENDFVKVPCGILDQGVSAFGRSNHLVHIDCRHNQFEHVRLPTDVNFWIFNTHTKHALVDGLYAGRHSECRQAATLLGVATLADATFGQLEAVRSLMPEPVVKRALHVLGEIARVREAIASLAEGAVPRVGKLLTASHRSSQKLFENSSPELNMLVDSLVVIPGVYGARLTGGGFGGAVLALTGQDFQAVEARAVGVHYSHRFGAEPQILQLRSGEGARVLNKATHLR